MNSAIDIANVPYQASGTSSMKTESVTTSVKSSPGSRHPASDVRRPSSHGGNDQDVRSPGRDHDASLTDSVSPHAGRPTSIRSAKKRAAADDPAKRLRSALVTSIGQDRFDRWFCQARIDVRADRVNVIADTAFAAKWIESQFGSDVRRIVGETVSSGAQVVFSVVPEAAAVEDRSSRDGSRTRTSSSARGQGHDDSTSSPSSSPARSSRLHDLSDFVIGSSNRMAHSAACRLAEGEHMQGLSPLFIHGDCGVGKTHLLQGVCRRFIASHPAMAGRVRYVTGEQFTNEYIAALRSSSIDSFRQRVRKLALLAIDDVHFLANKFKTQSEFQCTIDAIDFGGARVVMASDNHPHHIRQFSQSLVSRFVSGMVVRIDRPDRDLRAALIRRMAEARNLRLSDAAVEELASNIGASVRELEGAMTRLAAWRAMMHPDAPHTEIGLLLVQQVLGEDRARPNRIVRIASIIDAVCHRLSITRADLMSSGRHRRVVIGRSMVSYLARELTTMSFPEIAQSLGRDNHSTVHTADQRLRDQLKRDERLDPSGGEGGQPLRELADLLRRDICRGS